MASSHSPNQPTDQPTDRPTDRPPFGIESSAEWIATDDGKEQNTKLISPAPLPLSELNYVIRAENRIPGRFHFSLPISLSLSLRNSDVLRKTD